METKFSYEADHKKIIKMHNEKETEEKKEDSEHLFLNEAIRDNNIKVREHKNVNVV